jgi:preprotein translocase subunit SecD
MMRNLNIRLAIILVLVVAAILIDVNQNITIRNPFTQEILYQRDVSPRLGLDLRGGVQVLMEADLPANAQVDQESMTVARTILENRTNALGVSETSIQIAGERRIVGEFPGAQNADEVLATIQQTGLLEFIDTGTTPLQKDTVVQTDFSATDETSPAPTATQSTVATPTEVAPTEAPTATPQTPVYHTVMTGKDLKTINVTKDQLGKYQIAFTLSDNGAKIFATHTAANVNNYLTIVLDKKVISSPRIESAITSGQGVITGSFTADEANNFAVQLRYGSLPIPLKVVQTRIIGPTLGEDSLRKSLIAGVAGMIIVVLFMGLYYRLPGVLADLALIGYVLISFMLFKFIPVVLTLPGIAGFILSIGMAVDANVLIFERLREELRGGRALHQAIDLGWSRAWPSIRDSNISTLITCFILFLFGNTFGASIVKGFSITLSLGVLVSLFTAIVVTRTFLHLVLDNVKLNDHPRWFGL